MNKDLKFIIEQKGKSIPIVAKEMGINKTTLYRKIETDYFLVKDVMLLKEILNLSKDEIEDIFL